MCMAIILGWVIFVLWHVITFRLVKDKHLFTAIKVNWAIGAVIAFVYAFGAGLGWWSVVAVFIYTLGVFNYIVCIFGPLTTSIRIRLLIEMLSLKTPVSVEEIYKRYDEKVMVDLRLARLIGHGDVKEEGGKIILISQHNPLNWLKSLSQCLTKILGK